MLKKMISLFNEELWIPRSDDFPPVTRGLLQMTRILILTARRFWQNDCFLKASALTYYTMLSLVPILALAYGLTKGYGCSEILKGKLMEFLEQYPGAAEKIITAIERTLQNTKSGAIAGFGVLLLLWSAIKLMSHIERSLNAIWGIPKGRPFFRKVTDYLAILVICPFLIITGSSFLVAAKVHLSGIFRYIGGYSEVTGTFLQLMLTYIPLFAVLIVFAFIYLVIPNTKVKIMPALIAGVTAAVIYMLLLNFYVSAQSTVVACNAIYGSIAALPMFLIWLNLSWLLLLGGAQLTFAIQYVQEYEMLPVDCRLSQNNRYVYSMEILQKLSANFETGKGPLTDAELSRSLRVPVRTVRILLSELVRCGILSEVISGNQETRAYQQAQPTVKITPLMLISSLNDLDGLPFREGTERLLAEKLEQIYRESSLSGINQPLYQPTTKIRNVTEDVR